MMEAKELMIGNWVTTSRHKSNTEIYGYRGNQVWLSHSKSTTFYIHELQPIPLTEEWLLKFGFHKVQYLKKGNGQDWQPEYPRTEGFDFLKGEFSILYHTWSWIDKDNNIHTDPASFGCHWQDNSIKTVEFVHQLQNLFYCLTGEELTTSDQTEQKPQQPQ